MENKIKDLYQEMKNEYKNITGNDPDNTNVTKETARNVIDNAAIGRNVTQTPLVTRIGKDKKQKTYRIMFDDLYCDYNYLKPNISYYDKTEEKTVSEPNTIDTKIPLNKEGIKKIYSSYYANKQENNEDLPEAVDTVDGFISYVSGVSNQFALWTNGSIEAEQILASYTIEPKMIKELSGLENMINNFKTKAKLLEAKDTPTDKELKSMGVINPAELVKLKNKLASK